jgi:hypothetical protein
MRVRNLLVLCFIVIVPAPLFAQAQSTEKAVMEPGLWQITVQTVSPVAAAPLSHTVCIDKLHVTKPEPPRSKPSDDCKVTPDAAAANETAYTVRCGKKKTTTSSRFIYASDHFNGTLTVTTAAGDVQQIYTAVRLGDCDDLSDPNVPPPAH